jgi:hypothetical protein
MRLTSIEVFTGTLWTFDPSPVMLGHCALHHGSQATSANQAPLLPGDFFRDHAFPKST